MSEITLPEAVERFVATTNAHDADALSGVFAPEAVVVDDGTTYATPAAIRQWIQEHQVAPKIVITPISFESGRLVASIDGEFPGGPLEFAFAFTTEADTIRHLAIGLA